MNQTVYNPPAAKQKRKRKEREEKKRNSFASFWGNRKDMETSENLKTLNTKFTTIECAICNFNTHIPFLRWPRSSGAKP